MFNHIDFNNISIVPSIFVDKNKSKNKSKSNRGWLSLALPPEVLLKTFSFLKLIDLSHLLQVSRSWSDTINKMWQQFHNLHFYYHRHTFADDVEDSNWKIIYKECALTERYGRKLLQDLNSSAQKEKDSFLTKVNKNLSEEPPQIFVCEFEPVSVTVLLVGKDHVGKTSFLKRHTMGTFDGEIETTMGAQSVKRSILFHKQSQRMPDENKEQAQAAGEQNDQEEQDEEQQRKKNCFLLDLTYWDCSGQDRYSGLTQKMIQFAQVVVLFYDVTNSESVATMKQWWQELCTKKHWFVVLWVLNRTQLKDK